MLRLEREEVPDNPSFGSPTKVFRVSHGVGSQLTTDQHLPTFRNRATSGRMPWEVIALTSYTHARPRLPVRPQTVWKERRDPPGRAHHRQNEGSRSGSG